MILVLHVIKKKCTVILYQCNLEIPIYCEVVMENGSYFKVTNLRDTPVYGSVNLFSTTKSPNNNGYL